MTKIINLTPHACNIYREADDTLLMSVPASGKLARCIEGIHRAIQLKLMELRLKLAQKRSGRSKGSLSKLEIQFIS